VFFLIFFTTRITMYPSPAPYPYPYPLVNFDPRFLPTQVVPLPPPSPSFTSDVFMPVSPVPYSMYVPVHAAPAPVPVHAPTISKEEQELLDYEFARKLVLDDIDEVKKASSKTATVSITDSALARKLDAEERSHVSDFRNLASEQEKKEKRQIELDAALARKLESDERRLVQSDEKEPKLLHHHSHPNPHPHLNPNTVNFNVHQRNHIINVHNRHCHCGNTQPYNNNHLFKMHDQHCYCSFSTNFYAPNNAGKKHKHDHRCCNINHLHSEKCFCVYRTHKHGHNCCSLSHSHNELCHCSDK